MTQKLQNGIGRPLIKVLPRPNIYLGLLYDNGKGVPQDHAEAVKWYRKAAEQGDADAQCQLGLMYATDMVCLRTTQKQLKWFRKRCRSRVEC